ncbi:acyl-CoA carboxylase subunit beta [Bacillus solitudinis]|uniref:acyl-CoA carboxylase subunit beta n=1 Tax=Bacillus solitudinis TaxID=2014074 RepID=UPI000C250448|nr:acyl-CoA carboxylase subunit beta [Bacillus solitudinis]
MDIYEKIEEMEYQRTKIQSGGGEERIQAQYERGKQTARERITILLDDDSFVELNPFIHGKNEEGHSVGEGVVTGYGKIGGRLVFLFSQDFTVYGGAVGEMHALKITKVMDLAVENGAPIIGLNDSGGAKIQEGVLSLNGYGQIFYRNSIYSGVIPQISVIMGPCAGGAVYSPALTDFVFMVENTSQMFITGPKVIQSMTGVNIDAEELGGANVHSTLSGNAHFTSPSEEEVLNKVRQLVSFLPLNYKEKPPQKHVSLKETQLEVDCARRLIDVVPMDGKKPYDVRKVIELIVDAGEFMEVQKDFAKNIVVGFGRIHGRPIGIIANQPKYMAGGLDINASDKCSRFIRFCDCFNLPLLTFEDVSGFIPGITQEHLGIIRHGAKIIFAYSEATVPKITVILRKAYGGAYVALNSKAVGADQVFAWPNAEIAVMGPEGAASIIFKEEIDHSENSAETKSAQVEEYRNKFANPYIAAASGMVDDIIHPSETKKRVASALEMLQHKRKTLPEKKHGNIPF